MNTPIEAVLDSGPRPTIHRPYRSIRTTMRGRLSACTDTLGTTQLHLQTATGPGSRGKFVSAWRSGPLRNCQRVFDALYRSLAFLGEEASTEQALRLSRRIDRRLWERLTNFVLVGEGRYELLTGNVRFVDETAVLRGVPLSGSWAAAKTQGMITIGGSSGRGRTERPVRETFVLVRRCDRWEMWARIEQMDAGSMPSRHHAWMCSVGLLHEEPSLAAELLLYALFRRQRRTQPLLPAGPVGLITAQRLRILEDSLARAALYPAGLC